MRRWLTFVLLFVLPLQFTWAAAAAYCGHEALPAKAHIGHHAHAHEAGPGDSGAGKQLAQGAESKAAEAGKLTIDNDCGYCQLSLAKPMLPLALQFDTDAHACLDSAPNPAFESRGPDHPDRPNWRLA